MSLICVPIFVENAAGVLDAASAARDAGADLVELRIDTFYTGSAGDEDRRETNAILRLLAECPLPAIVTCRPAFEGGEYDGDDMPRISLLEHLGTAQPTDASHPPKYIDVELATLKRSANLRQKVLLAVDHPKQSRDLQTRLILSTHDFQQRPHDLTRRIADMRNEPAAAVLKIAFTARSLRDNLELFEITRDADRPTIALGIGVFGLMSRVLAPKFGALLTFATVPQARQTAPGQPTVADLLDTYRFRRIKRSTKVFGVVGWPVEHSISPHVHNAAFDSLNEDAVFLPLPIAAHESDDEASYLSFKATMDELLAFDGLDFTGASVTIPFKEHALRWARERGADTSAVERIGAANTLHITPDGSIRTTNTDAQAIALLLDNALDGLRGKRVAVVGAGGVARAAVWACVSAGATVIIYNRTRERADALAEDMHEVAAGEAKVVAADLDALPKSCAHAYINCTSVGMSTGPAPDQSPVPIADLRECTTDTVVFDTVYSPRQTPMLQQARLAGLRTIDGAQMFVEQAAMQSAWWTGQDAPKDVMQQAADKALSSDAD